MGTQTGWLVAVSLTTFLGGYLAGADRYDGFRGDGTGRSDATKLPLTWSADSTAWKVKLPGYGQSSPVVHGNKVFVTAIEGPMKEKNLVAAYDLATGKQLWLKELPATQKVKADFSISRAAPTPVVDAEGLYLFFESGELARMSHAGEQVWLRSLVNEYGAFQNGHQLGSSLAQTADSIYVLIDHQGPSYLLAVDKKTGKNRWKVDRKSRMSWSSPIVTRRGNRDLLIISSGGSVDVYDTSDGKQLSSYTEVGNNNVPSATIQGEHVVIGASDPPRGANRDLTLKSCCCLTLNDDGKLSEKAVWTSEKATASFASPLIHRDCVYYVNQVGVLFCLDLKTGKEHYGERTSGSCWASPVAAGDRIYLFDRNGVTTVVKAGPKFEKLASNRLWDATKPKEKPAEGNKEKAPPGRGGPGMASMFGEPNKQVKNTVSQAFGEPILYGVAVVDGALILRAGTELICIKG